MATIYDRKLFFDAVRKSLFGGKLSATQVSGMEAILGAAPLGFHIKHLAYALATAKWETAHTMQPINERGGEAYFFRMYDPYGQRPAVAKALGNTQRGDGAKFHGRGYVQLTGRANSLRASKALGVDFVANPDLALNPPLAAAIMFRGMSEGWFTGKKLSDYFTPTKSDWIGARRIINGTDRAAEIASIAKQFHLALQAAD